MPRKKTAVFLAEEYEELYDRALTEADGEAEYKKAVLDKGVRVYRARQTYAGRQLDVQLSAVWNARAEATSAKKARKAQSRETIERRNDKNTQRRIEGLLNENFGAGDVAMYLTMGKKETDVRAALKWFIRECRKRFKREGRGEFRYLYIVETVDREGEPLRAHVHIFLPEGPGRDAYEDLWRSRYGIANGTRLEPDENGLAGFAKYVMKEKRTETRTRRWACSRNLREPEIRRSTRIGKGKKLTKRFIYDLVTGRRDIKAELESAYPGYRLVSWECAESEYVSGVYLNIRLTRFCVSECERRGRGAAGAGTENARTHARTY